MNNVNTIINIPPFIINITIKQKNWRYKNINRTVARDDMINAVKNDLKGLYGIILRLSVCLYKKMNPNCFLKWLGF